MDRGHEALHQWQQDVRLFEQEGSIISSFGNLHTDTRRENVNQHTYIHTYNIHTHTRYIDIHSVDIHNLNRFHRQRVPIAWPSSKRVANRNRTIAQ
jgi:hypothetical protein